MTPALVVSPATFTDRTCFGVTGLTWRQFVPFALANNIHITKVGRRSVVRLDRYLEAVDRQGGAEPRPAWSPELVFEMARAGARR